MTSSGGPTATQCATSTVLSAFFRYTWCSQSEWSQDVRHEGKHLAGKAKVRSDAKGPLTVKLEPWGTVTGRLVTSGGKPLQGALLQVSLRMLPNDRFQTDKDGRFSIEGLAAGEKYILELVKNGNSAAQVFSGLILKSAESRDLGDIQVKPME